jgi:hypothetical protein
LTVHRKLLKASPPEHVLSAIHPMMLFVTDIAAASTAALTGGAAAVVATTKRTTMKTVKTTV